MKIYIQCKKLAETYNNDGKYNFGFEIRSVFECFQRVESI